MVFVGQFAFDVDQNVVALALDLVHEQLPLGQSYHFSGAQVPLPQVLRAGQHAVFVNAGLDERLRHMGAQRREGAIPVTDVGDDDRDPVNLEFPESVFRDVPGRADPFPTHSLFACCPGGLCVSIRTSTAAVHVPFPNSPVKAAGVRLARRG